MSSTEIHYAILEVVKKRLNIADDDYSLDDFLDIFISDVDNWINNKLRAKLGTYDYNGRFITLPLTTTTIPSIDPEMGMRASQLVVGRVRQEQSNDNNILKQAESDFMEYLNRVYGFTRDVPYKPVPTLTITPTNGANATTVVTVSGTQFGPNRIITISFAGIQMNTTPSQIITDVNGSFSGVTFTVPKISIGPYAVVAQDGTVGPYIVAGQVPNTGNYNGNFQQVIFLVTS